MRRIFRCLASLVVLISTACSTASMAPTLSSAADVQNGKDKGSLTEVDATMAPDAQTIDVVQSADTPQAPKGECNADAQCDDDNLCTEDACKTNNTCVHIANSNMCDKGHFCIGKADNFFPAPGCYQCYPAGTDCNDGNDCTVDTCDAGTCKYEAVSNNFLSVGCNADNNACTIDYCLAGKCTSTDVGVTKCLECTKDSDCAGYTNFGPWCSQDEKYEFWSENKGKCKMINQWQGLCPIAQGKTVACEFGCNNSSGTCKCDKVADCNDSDPSTVDICNNVSTRKPEDNGCLYEKACAKPEDCEDNYCSTLDYCILNTCQHVDVGGCGGGDPGDPLECTD